MTERPVTELPAPATCSYKGCRNKAVWMTGRGLLCTRHRNMFWRAYQRERLKMFKREDRAR